MKTGIELIAQERHEQLTKHQRSILDDVSENTQSQLPIAAMCLIEGGIRVHQQAPVEWDEDIWCKMVHKSYKDRLIIAGALIAAELDRLNAIAGEPQQP